MSKENESTPPEGLTGDALRDWWNNATRNISWKQKEGKARKCYKCGSLNPCSGVSTCGQCGHSLFWAKRVKVHGDLFDSP